jgi:hypothetical protein
MKTIHIWACAAFLVVMVIVPQRLAELAERVNVGGGTRGRRGMRVDDIKYIFEI